MVKGIIIGVIVIGGIALTIYSGIRFGVEPYYWGWIALIICAALAMGWDKYIRKK